VNPEALSMVARPLAGRALSTGGGATFAIEEVLDDGSTPGQPIAPLHRHLLEDEAWYVLEGRLGFRLGEEEREAGPGDAVIGPKGIQHTYWNPASTPTRYLLVTGPRTASLLTALHDGTSRDREGVADLFSQFGVELLG
jgi:mannose-6-phosphate isomerase-like protein (cupin superfamily)